MAREEAYEKALSKEELDFAGLLVRVGADPREARLVVFLARPAKGEPPTSAVIQRACKLRQPEVSTSARRLAKRGWVEIGSAKTNGRGRSVQCFRLTVPLTTVVDSFAELHEGRRNSFRAAADAVRAIVAGDVRWATAHQREMGEADAAASRTALRRVGRPVLSRPTSSPGPARADEPPINPEAKSDLSLRPPRIPRGA